MRVSHYLPAGQSPRRLKTSGRARNAPGAWPPLDEAQALGIARAMRDRGRLAPPWLVFEKGSPLEQKALNMAFPVCCGGFSRFQLWRWQRKHSRLIIQTVGQGSMPVGRMLLKMRKKRHGHPGPRLFSKRREKAKISQARPCGPLPACFADPATLRSASARGWPKP